MNTSNGDPKQLRNDSLAGIAVMAEDVEKAEELLSGIKAGGELLTFEGNRFTTYAAIADEALDGLTDFQQELEKSKLRYCLALSVPVRDLQTEPVADGGNVSRTFCSTNGLPFRTQAEVEDGSKDSGYRFAFKRPSFWLVKLVVDGNEGVAFYSTLFGQFRNNDGGLEYRPVTRKSFDAEAKVEVETAITKICSSEEQAARELNVNGSFLFAMVKPSIRMAETARRRQGLRASVNRTPVAPLSNALGDLFPGLANIPVAPAKKAEPVAAE